MALFKVVVDKKVRKKDLLRVPAKIRRKVIERIKELGANPYPVDSIRLKGRQELRIRQGSYRILYTVNEDVVTVIVVKVGHRKDVYK